MAMVRGVGGVCHNETIARQPPTKSRATVNADTTCSGMVTRHRWMYFIVDNLLYLIVCVNKNLPLTFLMGSV